MPRKRRLKNDEKSFLKGNTLGGHSPSGKRNQRPCKDDISGKCTNPSCDFWHPYVKNYKTQSGCRFGEKCKHREVDSQPNKKPKKTGGKNSKQEGRQNSWDQSSSCNSQKEPSRHMKIRERKGPSQGVTQRSDPHERSPYAPRFDHRSEEETLKRERCARRVALEMARSFAQAQRKG